MWNVLVNFVGNKYNLFGMVALCNLLMGYMLAPYLTMAQWWLMFVLLFINNFCIITYGMAQGMLMLSVTQEAMKKFLDSVEKERENDTK